MKRFYLLLFCILFVGLIAKPSFSEEGKEFTVNGYEWESLTEELKAGWALGFGDGVVQAKMEGGIFLFTIPKLMERKGVGTYEEAKKVINVNELFNEFQYKILLGEISCGQMVTGLDEFYKDYRNKNILVREAVYIVKLEIMGTPQEFIDQATRSLRMPLKDRIKEQESLLAGNQEYKTAWEKWGKYLPFSVIPTAFE